MRTRVENSTVELAVEEGKIVLEPTIERKLTLNERLELFDPKKHGGEVMAVEHIHELDSMAGTWTTDDANAFAKSNKFFEEIDKDLWK